MSFSVVTFGCRVNQAESLRLEAALLARGHEAVNPERADVVFVNTCSVTATADQGTRQAIRRVHRLNPAARIVATGCHATRDPSQVGALPGVVAVVPNGRKDELLEDVRPLRLFARGGCGADGASLTGPDDGHARPSTDAAGGNAEPATGSLPNDPCGGPIPGIGARTAWTLRVQTGCDERCSYCIVPATRGPSRSRPIGSLLAELDRLAGVGYKVVTLTGVHLGSFGRDLAPGSSLATLLAAIAREGLPMRFRLGSLEPMDATPEVVDLVAGESCFLPHLHLPLQHASDRVLASMRRPYRLADYSRLVNEVRRRLPDAAIGSDVIAGFPGETDADHREVLAYLHDAPLTHLHVFPYSERPGTEAARLSGRVPGPVVRGRAAELRAAGRRLSERFRRSQAGTWRQGLTIEDGSVAVTDNYLRVRVAAGLPRNRWLTVQVTVAASVLV
jgi:threonylcarbamoyladenosine tRNA methylthiotransferase MtaB